MPRMVAGCDNEADCDVNLYPHSHSAAQNARGCCFHGGAAAVAVDFCCALRAQLGKHGIMLEQGLCGLKFTDTHRHVKQVLKVNVWAVAESSMQGSPG